MSLIEQITKLRPAFVAIAQKEYDYWEQDEEGWDEDYGTGGICDIIAQGIIDILCEASIEAIKGGQDGDDHAFVIAYKGDTAFVIDIPYSVYETGGGYSWKKKPDVVFNDTHLLIYLTESPKYDLTCY
jgi:hypothetical protein